MPQKQTDTLGKYIVIFILVALFYAGCQQDNAVQMQLMQIDSLLSKNQDEKAYEMLQALTDTATASDVAYYNLLNENTSGQQKFIIIQQSRNKKDEEIAVMLAVADSSMRTYNSRIKRKVRA